MAEKVNAVTGKEQAKVKLFINGSHGDAVIKTVENVADNLHFVDGILFHDGNNPCHPAITNRFGLQNKSVFFSSWPGQGAKLKLQRGCVY